MYEGQNILQEWTSSLQNTISRNVNNSLPSTSVAGVQISSKRLENPSFTGSNLSLLLLHHAYSQRLDTRFDNRSLATTSARPKPHSAGVGGNYCLYGNQHRARVHCVTFHRKPLTLNGLFETPRKAAISFELSTFILSLAPV